MIKTPPCPSSFFLIIPMSFRTASQIAFRRSVLSTLKNRYSPISVPRQFHFTPSNMTVHNIESKEAFTEALKTNKAVIIDAFAEWCGPCKAISPVVIKFSDEEQFKDIFFGKIDVDALPDLSQELGITAMPTFIGFKDGEISQKVIGAKPQEILALAVGLLAE